MARLDSEERHRGPVRDKVRCLGPWIQSREGATTTALLLGYRDIEGARWFFLEAFGFEEDFTARDAEGRPTRSHVRFDDTVLMLDKPGAHGVLRPAEAGGLTHRVVLQVEDLDAHHARAIASGATILGEPATRPWGRDDELQDPEGYIFSFFQRSWPPLRTPAFKLRRRSRADSRSGCMSEHDMPEGVDACPTILLPKTLVVAVDRNGLDPAFELVLPASDTYGYEEQTARRGCARTIGRPTGGPDGRSRSVLAVRVPE